MKYYFAYGSNLNLIQMKKRCPDFKKIGSSILDDYKLLFRKHHKNGNAYLTIEKAKDKVVPIGIYEISEKDEATLDKREGIKEHCYKKEYLECDFNGNKIKGLVYIMENTAKAVPPQEYYEKVKQGYYDFNFDICYLEEAMEECDG